MRLIDADTLEKDLKSVTLSNGTLINTNTMIALLDKYQTAYDIDKVVEELEKIETHCLEMNDCQGQSAISDAIEIVKQGVVTDDVCEWTKYDYKAIRSPHGIGWSIPFMKDFKFCPYCGKKIKVVE